MYLKKDLLLNDFFPDICETEDFRRFIDRVFKNEFQLFTSTKSSQDAFALISFICSYISGDELSQMLGRFFSKPYTKNLFKGFIKNGDFETYKLKERDFGYAYLAYHLTDSGFKSHLSSLSDSLRGTDRVKQKRRTTAQRDTEGNMVPMHDYGIGLSLLSLMCMNASFERLIKEAELFDSSNAFSKGKRQGAIRVDALLTISDLNGERTIFLEQDTGTEGIGVLINKIGTYSNSRYLNSSENLIIFSFHTPYGGIQGQHLSKAELEHIDSLMVDYAYDKVYELYKGKGAKLSYNDRSLLERFLVSVDVCSTERDGTGLLTSFSSDDFHKKDLEQYITDFSADCNPYIARKMNAKRFLFAKKKLFEMYQKFYLIAKRGRLGDDSLHALLNGYSVLALPSALIANAAPFILPHSQKNLYHYTEAISLYYPDIHNWSSLEISEEYDLHISYVEGDYTPVSVSFRNALYDDNGRRICFEHIGKDLGGLVRLLLLSMAENRAEYDVHIIAICDCYDDIIRFASCAGPIVNIPSSSFYFSFLIDNSITDSGKAALLSYEGHDNVGKPICNLLERFDNKDIVISAECKNKINEAMKYRVEKWL